MAMRYADLREAFTPSGGRLVVAPGRLTANLQTWWPGVYGSDPLVLDAAEPGPGDGEGAVVVVRGTASFLRLSDLAVELRASLDAGGDVQLCVRYALRPAESGARGWRFSDSFPDLPRVVDWGQDGAGAVLLDALDLFDAAFIVVSTAQAERGTGVPLLPGINFVSQLRPVGPVAACREVFGQEAAVTLYGTVFEPAPTEPVAPVPEQRYPWDLDGPVPGILLQASLTGPAPLAGHLVLEGVAFRVYSATSADWERRHATYTAVQGYTATLRVPSAQLAVRATAELDWNRPHLFLTLDFAGPGGPRTGLTLADLADLAGGGVLTASLPSGLRDAAGQVGQIALTQAGLGLSLSTTGFHVDVVAITAGLPEAHWAVWADHLVVEGVVARFTVADPFGSAAATVEINGQVRVEGVPIRIAARSSDHYTVYAALAAEAQIPLRRLLATYAPGVAAPSDLTIDRLDVTVAPGTSYELSMAMAAEPNPWIIDLGPGSLRVSDLVLWLQYADGALAGMFSGDIAFGDAATLTIAYEVPGDFSIRGRFASVRLSEIATVLSGGAPPVPTGFDLSFVNTAVLIQRQGGSLVFLAATEVEGFGLLALEARRTATGWGLAAGLDLGPGRVAQLPALGALGPLVAAVRLDELVLVLSSFDDPGFSFPEAAAFDDPTLTGVLPASGPGGVRQGFNFYGRWTLDTADRTQNLLRDLLGITAFELAVALQVSLPDPGRASSVFAALTAEILGWTLQGRFGARLRGGSPELFVSGALTVAIQGQPQTFYVESTLVANGVFIAGSVSGATPITIRMEGVELFKLGNLALAVGCDWEGIPSFGVAATIAEGNFASSLAVFVNSAEPQKSVVAGAISDVTVGAILRTLTGGATSNLDAVLDTVALRGTRSFTIPGALAADLDGLRLDRVADAFAQNGVAIPRSMAQLFLAIGTSGEHWFLTALSGDDAARHYQLTRHGDEICVSLEAQLYCVPETTAIGQLTFHGPQFFINGAIELFGLRAQATITVDPARGLAVAAGMSPIVIYRESFFSVTSSERSDVGPQVSGASFSQPDLPDPDLRDPHLVIDGQIQVLGLVRRSYVRVTTSGLAFDLSGDVQPGVRLDTHGHFNGLTDFNFGGAATVGIGTIDLGPLGKVAINTGVKAGLDIGLQGEHIWGRLDFSVQFAEQSHAIQVALDVTAGQLADLAGVVYEAIKAFFLQLFSSAAEWMRAVAEKLVEGVQDAIAVLEDFYHKTEREALAIFNAAMDAAQKACAASRAASTL